MNFSTVEEIKDPAKMTASLQRMKRTKQSMHFLFKARCEELENQPLLLLASPGRKVDRTLVSELSGSRSVWGRIKRRGDTLVFVPKAGANREELVRLIAVCGNAHNVPIPRRNILVSSEAELKAYEAVVASVHRLRSVTTSTRFFFRERCTALNKGAALMLGKEAPLRALGSGSPIIRGTVAREGRGLTFTVTSKVNERRMARAITLMCRLLRARAPTPTVVFGKGAPVEEAPAETPSASKGAAARKAAAAKARKAAAAKAAAAQAKQEAKQKAKQKAKQEAKAKRAEAERAEREAAEREARAEEQRRAEEEVARKAAEEAAQKAADLGDPKLKRRYRSALQSLEDAREEITAAEASQGREEATFKKLKNADSCDDIIDLLSLLQDAITESSGKPDKELRKLQRIVQRADDVDDAIEECEEWYEERKEDLADELAELREEAESLEAKVEKLRVRIGG